MYKLLLFISIHCFYNSFSQNKIADTARKPCITPIGIPFGEIVSDRIDKEGGSIKSTDGKLELYFPNDALSSSVTISIQSCSNTMPSGIGTAYQMEPSGTQFGQPVKAVIHYNDKDLKSNPASLMSLALQDHNGQWSWTQSVKVDTISKTITGYIKHFSILAPVFTMMLEPQSATLKVNQQITLSIYDFITNVAPDDPMIYAYHKELYYETKELPIWRANGIITGNSTTGTVTSNLIGNYFVDAIYKAPAKVPVDNPVAVTAELLFTADYTGTEMKGGAWAHKETLVCNITIVENAYRFTYIHKNFAGCFHYIDSSSCIINLDKKVPELLEVTNYKPWSDWDRCGKCTLEYTNKETFNANVEIWGMQNSKIIPATKEKPMSEIYIGLLPAFGNSPAYWQQCPKSPKVVVPSMTLPADPKYIHFETDGNEIIVHYLGESGKNMISRKVKNEETIIKVIRL